MNGTDVFFGPVRHQLAVTESLLAMATKPMVFACSKPDPEINPELTFATRDDLILATGCLDYPNKVNSALGFPFIFRGAFDARARIINEEMKIAAVESLRQLAKEPASAKVLKAFNVDRKAFGRN